MMVTSKSIVEVVSFRSYVAAPVLDRLETNLSYNKDIVSIYTIQIDQ